MYIIHLVRIIVFLRDKWYVTVTIFIMQEQSMIVNVSTLASCLFYHGLYKRCGFLE